MDEGVVLNSFVTRYVVVEQPPYPFLINGERLPVPKTSKPTNARGDREKAILNENSGKRNRYRPDLETKNFPDDSAINFNLTRRRDGHLTSGKIFCRESGVRHPGLAINWVLRRYDGLEEYVLVIRQYKLNCRGNNSSDGEVVVPFDYSRNLKRKRVVEKGRNLNSHMSRIEPDEVFRFFRKWPDEPEIFETSHGLLDGAKDIFVGPEYYPSIDSNDYIFVRLDRSRYRSLPMFRFRFLLGKTVPILQISSFSRKRPASLDVAINWSVELKHLPEAVITTAKSKH